MDEWDATSATSLYHDHPRGAAVIDPALRTRIRALFFAEHWKVATIFKKVFGDLEVFNRFVSDVLGVTIEVDAVHQEYRYPEAVGRVNIEYDLFGEDARHRVVVEVQHIRESDPSTPRTRPVIPSRS